MPRLLPHLRLRQAPKHDAAIRAAGQEGGGSCRTPARLQYPSPVRAQRGQYTELRRLPRGYAIPTHLFCGGGIRSSTGARKNPGHGRRVLGPATSRIRFQCGGSGSSGRIVILGQGSSDPIVIFHVLGIILYLPDFSRGTPYSSSSESHRRIPLFLPGIAHLAFHLSNVGWIYNHPRILCTVTTPVNTPTTITTTTTTSECTIIIVNGVLL